MTLSRSLPVNQANASDFKYESPAQMPFSPEREKANQAIYSAPKPQVLKVSDHVYTAVSYALATMILVETSEGSVIIDTTESPAAVQTIMGEFRKIADRPVKVVIYTHHHGDHFRGTKAFYDPGMQVISHKDFMAEVKIQEARGKSGAMR